MVNNSKFSIVSQNIRSLNKNFELLKPEIAELNPDLIFCQEIWQPKGYYNLINYDGQELNERKTSKGGGVVAWCRKNLNWKREETMEIFEEGHFESLCISVSNFIFVNVYRPPSGNFRKLLSSIKAQLEFGLQNNKKVFFIGDFNIDWKSGNKKRETLEEIMIHYNMKQKTKVTTRLDSNTILDLAFMPSMANCKVKVRSTEISDHDMLYAKLNLNLNASRLPSLPTAPTQKYKFTKDNIDIIKKELTSLNWNRLLNDGNVDKNASDLEQQLKLLLDTHCKSTPSIKAPVRMPRDVWKLKLKLRKLKKRWKSTGLPECKNAYKTLKKEYRNKIFDLRNMALKSQLNSTDPRKIWQAIKDTTRTAKPSQKRITIKSSSNPVESLAEHFETAAELTIKSIPTVNHEPTTVLQQNVTPRPNRFHFKKVTPTDVFTIFKKIAPKKSSGHDGISSWLIKQLKYQLIEPMTILANKVILHSKFPNTWKEAKVIPLHKKGPKDDPTNYRPISLLPSLSKIIEKIMVKQMTDYFETQNLFPPRQFGFRAGYSTTHAVNEVALELQKTRQRKAVLLLDFSKAFDVINHKILLKKLKIYGFDAQSRKLVLNYLTGRAFKVYANNEFSSLKYVSMYGCPQGSIIGPLMYLIYTSDLQYLAPSVMYADDTAVTITLPPQNKEAAIERLWNTIFTHCSANQLKLNGEKTEVLTNDKTISQIVCNNNPVKPKSNTSTKYLGVMINANLNWNDHLAMVMAKMKKGLHALAKLKGIACEKTKLSVYECLVKSHALYALPVWGPVMTAQQTNKVNALLKSGIRLITESPPLSHTKLMLHELKQTLFPDLCDYHTMSFYYNMHVDNPNLKYMSFCESNTRSAMTILPKTKGKINCEQARIIRRKGHMFAQQKVLRRYELQTFKEEQLQAHLMNIQCVSNCISCKRTPPRFKL